VYIHVLYIYLTCIHYICNTVRYIYIYMNNSNINNIIIINIMSEELS
jgi:uncharacterized protein YlbG (UPF0298 family)